MSITRTRILATLSALLAVVVFSGAGCASSTDKLAAQRTKPLTLKYWRVFDDTDAFAPAIAQYTKLHDNVTIEYRKFRFDEYQAALLNALAEGSGPDVISLHNTWMHNWQSRLLPVPKMLSVPYRQALGGGLQKTETASIVNTPGVTIASLMNDFVDVVQNDAILTTIPADPKAQPVQQIYGLPLSVDSLVMFYNQNLLDSANIPEPAKTWTDFQTQVKKITKLDQSGAILVSGAAIGTADNVERSSDILGLLMMQNGAVMTDGSGKAAFDQYTDATKTRPLPPGAEALQFYTDFANPVKEVYTWNANMPDSLTAFAKGQVAYFFGYAYDIPLIRQANSQLKFGIAPCPQVTDDPNAAVYYANYWLETVSNKTQYPDQAWDFVQFLTKADQAKTYLKNSDKPTALRSLVDGQLSDPDLGVFAAQVPRSKSWYHGNDSPTTESIFRDMITQALAGDADLKHIVQVGAGKVNQTL